jgi:dipeptidyl aminopeptidase/acylaminoacyl peptidase
VSLNIKEKLDVPEELYQFIETDKPLNITMDVVEFKVGEITQYGIIVAPKKEGKHPLILYLHGAAFGVPYYSLPWLAKIANEGYVIAAPALRGEELFSKMEIFKLKEDYKSQGKIENLDGEVDDALGMVDGAFKLPNVRTGKYAILAHSFGAGVGLLTAARSKNVACVVSYDAWLVNPFRYYWDRLSGGANNWLSWEAFTESPVNDQLNGLLRRSIVHNAKDLNCPLLLFIGAGYDGSVFHQSHDDLLRELDRLGKTYDFDKVPDGGHNFMLYYKRKPAIYAYEKQMKWLRKHLNSPDKN